MSHPSRLRSFAYVGHNRYFVTTCAYQRRPVFQDAAIATMVTDEVLQSARGEECEVLAYCFMPDHVHLLVVGASAHSDFPRFMKLAKQRSGWRYTRDTGQRLWQAGYHERVLRGGEDTVDVVRYRIANPIRAGIVACAGDYDFWGSATYSRDEILAFVSEGRQT